MGKTSRKGEDFVYLGSNISKDGGSDRDIQVRIGKARTAFTILCPVWKSKTVSRKTKLRIFNTNVKSVQLYGSETWRVTTATSNKLQSFVNKCLRSIGIHWPGVIRNEDLWAKTDQERMDIQIRRRKWGWIGHTLRKPNSNGTRHALRWNPQGKCSLDDLVLKASGDNDLIQSDENAIHCIELILHTVERFNIWNLFAMFQVPGKYPDGQFLQLGIFASLFLDLIYNDSMLCFQDIFDYSL